METPKLNLCGYFNSRLSFPDREETHVRTASEYEIEYIQEDGGVSVINGCKYQMKKDSVIIARPGDQRYSILTAPLVSIYLRIDAYGELAQRLDSLPSSFMLLKSGEIRETMTDIISGFDKEQTDELYIIGKLFLLISLLSADSTLENKKLAPLYPRMHGAKKYIEEHYHEQIKTEDIAHEVFMSESHFRASFREFYGITPHDCLIHSRVEAAKTLLANTTHSHDEIAAMCCLGSAKNFSTLFRKKTGMTPKTYRHMVTERYSE